MILIFGGTTEGRHAIRVCEEAGKPFYYSTKGDSQQVEMHHGVRLTGALTGEQMTLFCRQHGVQCIIDAAHPFAVGLHSAIESVGLPVIRLQRLFSERLPGVTYCRDYDDAITRLEESGATCLLALSGVNTIAPLRPYWQQHRTLFRILDREESRSVARQQGFPSEALLYYNDGNRIPTTDEEVSLMRSTGCDAVFTKESGESGGFQSKVAAALRLRLPIFVLQHPPLPQHWHYVTGPYGLRRAIEHLLPSFFPLRTGFTTGACATAATKAALLSLLTGEVPEEVHFALPDGEVMSIPVEVERPGTATVVKDYSDDPDVTRGCRITAQVAFGTQGIRFLQGEGVGRVTLPGLGIPVGGPAINSTPREMMMREVRALTPRDVDITISVEGGAQLAKQTFNPRVGVVDGISIIGTSGIVSPLSNEAFIQSIGRELQVARAIGCSEIGIASGRKGEEALQRREPQLRVIHYGNFIGDTLQQAHRLGFRRVVLGIMLGKAVKLAEGHLDTHSHRSVMNLDFLYRVARECCPGTDAEPIRHITMARQLWALMPPAFFRQIERLCLQHCRTVFPIGELEILLICDDRVS